MASYYGQPAMNPYWQNGMYQSGGYQTPMQVPVQQSYSPAPMSSNVIPVDGEVGAKAYMIPNGSTGPIALWDTNDNVIYMRTFNSAGMPNPLKRLRYVEEEIMPALPSGQSGNGESIDPNRYVTREDFEELRNEIRAMNRGNMSSQSNQNGSQSRGNSSAVNQGRQG